MKLDDSVVLSVTPEAEEEEEDATWWIALHALGLHHHHHTLGMAHRSGIPSWVPLPHPLHHDKLLLQVADSIVPVSSLPPQRRWHVGLYAVGMHSVSNSCRRHGLFHRSMFWTVPNRR